MIVRCKNNVRDPRWNFLIHEINKIYNAEIIATDGKDYIKVYNSINKYGLFTFKTFADNFKIVEL